MIVLSSDSRPMENMKPSTAYVYLSLARLGWSAVVSQDHWLTVLSCFSHIATSAGPQRLRDGLGHLLFRLSRKILLVSLFPLSKIASDVQ